MKNNETKLLSLLGLANRARKLISGEETVINAIKKNQVHVVVIAEDASMRTTKTVTDKCRFYSVPLIQKFDRTSLGHAIGKHERVLVGVTEKGFGERMMALSD